MKYNTLFCDEDSNQKRASKIANHSSDIGFPDFMNHYKKCTGKPYSSLAIDTNLASDNSPGFRKNLLEKI